MKNSRSLTAIVVALAALGLLLAGTCTVCSASESWSWRSSATGGFGLGTGNSSAMPLSEYEGRLYAGAMNGSGAQVWRLDGAAWTNVAEGGFGDSGNSAVTRMVSYDGSLYAGTVNLNGCGLWRYDGTGWTDALASPGPGKGFGDTSNIAVTAMEVRGDKLYVGLTSLRLDLFNPGSNGASIWEYDGATGGWTKMAEGGFGDTLNAGVTSLREHGGAMYAGTARMQVTTQLVDLGHLRITVASKGCQLWKEEPGSWAKVADGGFGDVRNIAVSAMEEYDGNLMVGTANAEGSITFDFSGNITESTFDTNGLGVYRCDGGGLTQLAKGFGGAKDLYTMSMVSAGTKDGDVLLVAVGCTEGAGKLMAYDGTAWDACAQDGFGNQDNSAVLSLAVLDGLVYAGTANSASGCDVWVGTPPLPEPSISGLATGAARIGDTLAINGSDFGASRLDSTVTFGNVSASAFGAWGDTSISVVVPDGISGQVPVVVATGGGASSAATFGVVPVITKLSPTSGAIGSEVAITGNGFGDLIGSSHVHFGSRAASTYASWSQRLVRLKVPSGVSRSVSVTVTTPGGTSNASSFKVTPTVRAIFPTSGRAGSYVTVSGSAFGASRGSSYVAFGTRIAGAFSSWTDTKLKVKVPSGVKGKVYVRVYTSAGKSNGVSFKVI